MLYFITGRIGSGKTTYIHERICEFARGGDTDITLIVPEQFSFASERMMLERLGAQDMKKVNVLSFSRLADKLVPHSVTENRRPADEVSRRAVMGLALNEVQDKLCIYDRSAGETSLTASFLTLYDEMRRCGVGCTDLRNAAEALGDCVLARKLTDISIINEAYYALLSRSAFDANDMMDYLYDELKNGAYFKDKLVFIDAFRGFTAQELRIIECMLRDARAVYVSLIADEPGECSFSNLFAHTKVTEKKLLAMCGRLGVNHAKPLNMSMGNKYNNFPTNPVRYTSPCLKALEANLFDYSAGVYEDDCPDITLCTAPDIYSECELVSAQIKKLIREQGYRCRDIAVISRFPENYDNPLRCALRKNGINVFEDNRRRVDKSLIFTFVDAVLYIAAHGFRTEQVLRYIKTGLTSADTEETGLLENYTYIWQKEGRDWLYEFTSHPDGFGAQMNEKAEERLNNINIIREKTVEPLKKVSVKLENITGQNAAAALYDFIVESGARERYKVLAEKSADENVIAELDLMWDTLMQLFDSLASLAPEKTFTARELYRIWQIMTDGATVGSIPTGLDDVTVGGAERIRMVSPKVAFIVGANSGVFPANVPGSSALTDSDREKLEEFDIELSAYGEAKIAEEKLIAYTAFCCASEKLYVCTPSSGSGSSEPSELVTRIAALFPKCRKLDYSSLPGEFFVESEQTAFEQLSREMPADSDLYKELREHFESAGGYKGRLEALDRASSDKSFEIEDKEIAGKLFPANTRLSASRIEAYNKCPFAYFCNYGIKAKPVKKAEIDVLERGTIIHFVLEKLLSKYKDDSLLKLEKAERASEIRSLLNEYIEEFLGGREGKSKRFLHNMAVIARNLDEIVTRLVSEFSVSEFRPVDFELEVGEGCEVNAYEASDDTVSVKIQGKIDRVDTAVIDGEKYIRVVDYKTGGKEFKLSDVLNGFNMQMLLYLFALWSDKSSKYGSVNPAAVLYYSAKTTNKKFSRSDSDDKILLEKEKSLGMKGILINNTKVILAMEKDAAGVFIPAKYNPGDGSVKGSLVSLYELGLLKKKVDEQITLMAHELSEGRIEDSPVMSSTSRNPPCQYCDYKAVCFYEDGKHVSELPAETNDSVLEMLREEAQTDAE